MYRLEHLLISFLLNFASTDQINAFFRDPQTTATLVGGLVAISGALLGTFLLLRRMALTSDAISHTVLLGIVVAFLVMTAVFGMEADLSSPLLIIGAALAGVATVILTEAIQRSGLVKADVALGLAFPFLFAISVILISRFADNVHLDVDSVIVGEIGLAWANTNSHCFGNCDEVVITPDHPKAETGRVCINCSRGGISPRDPEAQFEDTCANCGTYTAAAAWQARLVDSPPTLVFFPKAIMVMGAITLVVIGFVTLFYKELKLATFDSALALALGFRPGVLHYALMILVSVAAVGAFDAVGSILVIAFFIIPPATAYLLTNRLAGMLILSPLFGVFGAYTGYGMARGDFWDVLAANAWLNQTFGLGALAAQWDTSISAAMVLMLFVFFVLAWVFSPRFGLVSTLIRRRWQRQYFADQVVLGHIYNHQHQAAPEAECELSTRHIHEHFQWSPARMRWMLTRLQVLNLVQVQNEQVRLTERGERQIQGFKHGI